MSLTRGIFSSYKRPIWKWSDYGEGKIFRAQFSSQNLIDKAIHCIQRNLLNATDSADEESTTSNIKQLDHQKIEIDAIDRRSYERLSHSSIV